MQNRKLKILTRASKLAIKQADEVIFSFPGIEYEIIPVRSYGDKHKRISLDSVLPADFFTRELDEMLLRGKADVAIHSAKDVPFPVMEGLEVIALTKADDRTDSLVSRNNVLLKNLAPGSVIGASSGLRKQQLSAARPDLKIVPVRGAIEERLKLIDNKDIDALIVATCALKRLGLGSKIAEILPFETHPLQGSLAVASRKSRADLKVLFSKIDARQTYGKVYIVGAGSGRSEFLTIQAQNIMEHADIIFYDDLIDKTLLDEFVGKKVYVGKRKGKHSISQDEINKLIYHNAQRKQIVVRLKGGDPFVFGRGGEEAEYLKQRYVDVEVIAGVTSAQTAAASAQIPLTIRELSNKLTLLSGHNACKNKDGAGKTLVYYMGASKLKEISGSMLKQGVNADTPVALIRKAGFIDEKVTVTTVRKMKNEKQDSPLVIIAGKTAGLYKTRPKILFTGLDVYGCLIPGRIMPYPLIKIEPMEFSLEPAIYDGIIFTSRQAVQIFCRRYAISKAQKIISIGRQTSREIAKRGYAVDYESELADSDVLAELITKLKLQNILYPCSNISNNSIHSLANVKKKIIYKTLYRKQPRLNLSAFNGIVFTSPSTVKSFFKIYGTIPRSLVLYVYGKRTAEKLISKGYASNVQTISLSQD